MRLRTIPGCLALALTLLSTVAHADPAEAASKRVVLEASGDSPRLRAVAAELRALGFELATAPGPGIIRVSFADRGPVTVIGAGGGGETLDGDDDAVVARRVAESVRAVASATPAATPPKAESGEPPANAAESGAADTRRPLRKGFTLELGIGGSYLAVNDAPRVESGKFGLAPLNFGIGGFLSRNVALTFRGTGASLFQDRRGNTEQVLLAFYGGAVQVYVTDRVFVGAGAGVGVLMANPFASTRLGRDAWDPLVGWSLLGRVGGALVATKHHQLSIVSEVVPGFFSDASAVGVTLGLGYQYY